MFGRLKTSAQDFQKSVCIVSHNQVWANTQLSGAPHRMVWDLSDARFWYPMFRDEKLPENQFLDHVQRPTLSYTDPSRERCREIEDKLKRTVKNNLKEWRNRSQPIYQERAGTILREILVEMETERINFANFTQGTVGEMHTRAIQEINADRVFVGAPVNAPYCDESFKTILELVHETAVHEVGTDDVRFAVGVYVHGYTATVMSLWVYLIAMCPQIKPPSNPPAA